MTTKQKLYFTARYFLSLPAVRHILSTAVAVALSVALTSAGMNEADANGVGQAVGEAVRTAPL